MIQAWIAGLEGTNRKELRNELLELEVTLNKMCLIKLQACALDDWEEKKKKKLEPRL